MWLTLPLKYSKLLRRAQEVMKLAGMAIDDAADFCG